MMRQVDLVDRLADQDARGVDPRTGLALRLDHRHAEAARGSRPRRGEPSKARAHDHNIESHGSRPKMSPGV